MVFTEFVGMVISVVLAVVSETEVGLGVVLELVELRGSSPARGNVDVVFVVVEAVVVQVILFQKLSFFQCFFFHEGIQNITAENAYLMFIDNMVKKLLPFFFPF